MFDINDMAKAAFEPILSTPLQRAQKDGYVNIIGVEGKKIEYITSEKHVENYEDPEEKVRAEFFAELIQLEENKKLRGQPGVESITKQYLYQLAYQPFVEDHQIKTVRNCFLMPTNGNDVVVKGAVSLAILSSLGLQDIQIRLLPAETMYKHYIENTKMDISILQL